MIRGRWSEETLSRLVRGTIAALTWNCGVTKIWSSWVSGYRPNQVALGRWPGSMDWQSLNLSHIFLYVAEPGMALKSPHKIVGMSCSPSHSLPTNALAWLIRSLGHILKWVLMKLIFSGLPAFFFLARSSFILIFRKNGSEE